MNCFKRLVCAVVVASALVPAVQAASLSVEVRDGQGQPIEHAVVYITSINGQMPASTPQEVIVDQVDEAFVPHVRATTIGSRVNFPNSDHIRHHVYSFSEALTFEVPLYIGIPAEPIVFGKAGVVTLGCNIHDHMLGYILVLETPWFAEIAQGHAEIDDLPAGEAVVELWHPRLEAPVKQTLQLQDGSATPLALQVELRAERMVRRAPRRSGSRY